MCELLVYPGLSLECLWTAWNGFQRHLDWISAAISVCRAAAMNESKFYKIFFDIVAEIIIAVSLLVVVWCCLYQLRRPADNPILNEIDGMEVARQTTASKPIASPDRNVLR